MSLAGLHLPGLRGEPSNARSLSSITGDRMADDPTQRPYRSHETLARAPGPPSGGDPLAELARLIGQNDPFSEFGRDAGRRLAAPPQAEPAPDWDAASPLGGFPQQTAAPEK